MGTYDVFMVNEAIGSSTPRGEYTNMIEAIQRADEEIKPRTRKFVRAVVLSPRGAPVYERYGTK